MSYEVSDNTFYYAKRKARDDEARVAFIKALMADLKKVYAAVDEQTALSELDDFDEKWSSKYPKIAMSWRANWANLSTYFKYTEVVRTLDFELSAFFPFL